MEGKELDPAVLRTAQLRRLPQAGLVAKGRVRFPAVPSMVGEFVERLGTLFAGLGRPFNATELDRLRELLERKAREGFEASAHSGVVVNYETEELPKRGLVYTVSVVVTTVAEEYATWVSTREPPLFGTHPDAKVMELSSALGERTAAPVLDIGAGTGRNTLPLARLGHPTDAVELSPDLAEILRGEIARENLPVRVFEGDALGPHLDLPRQYYQLVVLSEVVFHFRSAAQVRTLFERAAEVLKPGGILAFSIFLPEPGYAPDTFAREFSQAAWCTIFTRDEVAEARAGLPFEPISDESVFEYERDHLPEEAWPPVGWFEEWTTARDMFDLPEGESPVDMRWLVFRRGGA